MAELEGVTKLSKEEIKEASGGYVHHNSETGRWDIIDDQTGEVLESGYAYKEWAQTTADHWCGMSMTELSDEELEKLRHDYFVKTSVSVNGN